MRTFNYARKLHKNLHNPQNRSIRKITTLVKSNLKNTKTVPYLLLLLSSAGFCGLRRGWRSFVLLGRLHQQENKGKKAIEIEEAPDKKKKIEEVVLDREKERDRSPLSSRINYTGVVRRGECEASERRFSAA